MIKDLDTLKLNLKPWIFPVSLNEKQTFEFDIRRSIVNTQTFSIEPRMAVKFIYH